MQRDVNEAMDYRPLVKRIAIGADPVGGYFRGRTRQEPIRFFTVEEGIPVVEDHVAVERRTLRNGYLFFRAPPGEFPPGLYKVRVTGEGGRGAAVRASVGAGGEELEDRRGRTGTRDPPFATLPPEFESPERWTYNFSRTLRKEREMDGRTRIPGIRGIVGWMTLCSAPVLAAGWARTYGPGSGVGVAVSPGGTILVTAGVGTTMVFAFAIDADGKMLWATPLTNSWGFAVPRGSGRTPDGGVAIVCDNGQESSFLVKLTSAGAQSFGAGLTFDSSFEPYARGVEAFSDGSLLVTASLYEVGSFSYRPAVYKLTSTGAGIWGRLSNTWEYSSVAVPLGSAVAWKSDSSVRFLDGSTGNQTSAWAVASPSTIASRASGKVAVSSGLRVFDLASNGTVTRSVQLAGNAMTGVAALRDAPTDGSLLVSLSAPNGAGTADDAAALLWLTDAGTVASQVTLAAPVSITAIAESPLGVAVVGTSAARIFVANFDRVGPASCWPTTTSGISASSIATTLTAVTSTPVNDSRVTGSNPLIAASDPTSISAPCVTPDGIGDRVFDDQDGDGIQDASEPGIANVAVQLRNAAGSVVSSRTTDPSGWFWFAGTAGASYQLGLIVPAGKVLAVVDAGGDDSADSDFDSATSRTPLVPPGGARASWDGGLVPACVVPTATATLAATPDGPDARLAATTTAPPGFVTGLDVYRSSDPAASFSSWTSVVVDGAIPLDWKDSGSGSPATPAGVWYYDVVVANSRCPAEGPR